jgi:hypothetical protein
MTESAIEKIKSTFTCCTQELEYKGHASENNEQEFRFSWCGTPPELLPQESGVYCLFSHKGSNIQKIGKAESKGGLRNRFRGYTNKKTEIKIASDKTDLLWKKIMMDKLLGQKLQVYYYVTPPPPKD